MTVENSKRLYDHYVAIGKTKAAEDMLAKYPDFAKKSKAPKKAEKMADETQDKTPDETQDDKKIK